MYISTLSKVRVQFLDLICWFPLLLLQLPVADTGLSALLYTCAL